MPLDNSLKVYDFGSLAAICPFPFIKTRRIICCNVDQGGMGMSTYAAFMTISAFVIFMGWLSMEDENPSLPGKKAPVRREDQGACRSAVSCAIKGLRLAPFSVLRPC